ncbi:Alpha/Beta hydrolase protein [Apiospora sp. TS-2023a]
MECPAFVHAEYWRLLGGQTPSPAPPTTDVFALRDTIRAQAKSAADRTPIPAGMTMTDHTLTSADGTEINMTRFVPRVVQQQQEANPETSHRSVVFAFGGGMVAGTVAEWRPLIAIFAERAATQVFATDYRLAPEHPYPAALEDMYASLLWVRARAGEFNLDRSRIVLFGASAGANLMVAVAMRARDEKLEPPIAGQVLRYPMLDDRARLADDQDWKFPYLVWTPSANAVAWEAYLKNLPPSTKDGQDDAAVVPDVAAPGRAQDVRGLPPTQIGVGSLDLFCDDAVAFAERLTAQGVRAHAFVVEGMPHGIDIEPSTTIGHGMWNDEAAFVQQF